MKTVLKMKSYIGIVVAFLVVFFSLSEILDYNTKPLEYEWVYHMGSDGVEWKYQSGQNFITWNIGLIIFAVLYIIANLFFLFKFKENKVLKFIILCVEIIFIVWVIWSLYEWN